MELQSNKIQEITNKKLKEEKKKTEELDRKGSWDKGDIIQRVVGMRMNFRTN